MLPIKRTARQRLETFANISRIQTDEETYDLERSVVGSVAAGTAADRCGQCCACDRAVVSVAVGNRETGDMEMSDDEYRRLMDEREIMRKELDRAWRQVDAIALERDKMIRERDSSKIDLESVCDERDQQELWRRDLAGQLAECERHRDAIGVELNKYQAVYAASNALMARLGYDGNITTDSPLVETLMNALDEIDNEPKG